jgi:hypothetical protein
LQRAIDAKSVRLVIAVRDGAKRRDGDGASHEVNIEIAGEKHDGSTGRIRRQGSCLDDPGVAAGKRK